MRTSGIALVLFALAGVHGADLLNSDFEDLKGRLVGTWSFTGNGQSYDATFEAVAHGHAILERNSGFIAVYHPDGVHFLLMTLYTMGINRGCARKTLEKIPSRSHSCSRTSPIGKKEWNTSMVSSSSLKIAIT